MLRLRRAPTAESSSPQSGKQYRTRLGVWLSMSPPRIHRCSLCSRRFRSRQALGGHQNAHRLQRNEMHKMYMKILEDLKPQERKNQKKPLVTAAAPFRARAPPVKAARNDLHHQFSAPVAIPAEVDLELGLACGASKKTLTFYEFLPLKNGRDQCGAAASGSKGKEICHDETPNKSYNPNYLTSLGYGYGGGQYWLFRQPEVGAGAVVGGFGEPSASVGSDEWVNDDEYLQVFYNGGANAAVVEVTSKTLDLTLKL